MFIVDKTYKNILQIVRLLCYNIIFLIIFFHILQSSITAQEASQFKTLKATNDSKQMMKKAEEHYYAKRFNIALKLFELVIQKDPENFLAYRYAGDILLLQKKLKQAKEHFDIARELSLQPAEEWFRIAQVHILTEESEAALNALKVALKLKPDMYICYFYIGLVHFKFFRNKIKTIENWQIYKKNILGKEQKKIQRALDILRQKDYVIPYKTSKRNAFTDQFYPIR